MVQLSYGLRLKMLLALEHVFLLVQEVYCPPLEDEVVQVLILLPVSLRCQRIRLG